MRLALSLEQLVHNDAGDPCDGQTGNTQQADEEKFECEKHVSIIFRGWSLTGNSAFHTEEYEIWMKHKTFRLLTPSETR